MNSSRSQDIRSAAQIGLVCGAVLAAWATVVFRIHGNAAFEKQHITFAKTLVVYLGGGLVAGAIVGLLKPLTRRDIGVPVVGIAAAFPVLLGLRFATTGFGEWTEFDVAYVGFGTLLFGLFGALIVIGNRNATGRQR